jgi:hypothetical protein
MDKVADLRIVSIQLKNLSQKPKLLSTIIRNGHSKVSKVLVMSIFRAKLPP